MSIDKLTCRQELPSVLPVGATVVELGVAKGYFSKQLLQSARVGHLYSVDAWAGDRGHNESEFNYAIELLRPYKDRNTILPLRFDSAVKFFADEFFDLVYIDGYAHEGNEGGETIRQWWPKVKRGGILAGHDYHDHWRPAVEAVDKFASENNLKVHVIPAEPGQCTFPSWAIEK